MTEYEEVRLTLNKLMVQINALVIKRASRPPTNPHQSQPQTQKPKEE